MNGGSQGYRIIVNRPLVHAIVEEAATPSEAVEKYRAATLTFGRCDLVLEEIGIGVVDADDLRHLVDIRQARSVRATRRNASRPIGVVAPQSTEHARMNRIYKRCPTVLVVEDEILERLSLADFLRQCGCTVIEAHDAHEASQLLHAGRKVDFLFADMRLPGEMDGAGLARWMRVHHPDVPVVLTSGHHAALAAAAELCTGRSVVPKPYVLTEVARTIRTLLAAPATPQSQAASGAVPLSA